MTDTSKDPITITVKLADGTYCGQVNVDPGVDLVLSGTKARELMVKVVDLVKLGQRALDVRAKLEAQDKADKLALGGEVKS
jgi:hypothetical protein